MGNGLSTAQPNAAAPGFAPMLAAAGVTPGATALSVGMPGGFRMTLAARTPNNATPSDAATPGATMSRSGSMAELLASAARLPNSNTGTPVDPAMSGGAQIFGEAAPGASMPSGTKPIDAIDGDSLAAPIAGGTDAADPAKDDVVSQSGGPGAAPAVPLPVPVPAEPAATALPGATAPGAKPDSENETISAIAGVETLPGAGASTPGAVDANANANANAKSIAASAAPLQANAQPLKAGQIAQSDTATAQAAAAPVRPATSGRASTAAPEAPTPKRHAEPVDGAAPLLPGAIGAAQPATAPAPTATSGEGASTTTVSAVAAQQGAANGAGSPPAGAEPFDARSADRTASDRSAATGPAAAADTATQPDAPTPALRDAASPPPPGAPNGQSPAIAAASAAATRTSAVPQPLEHPDEPTVSARSGVIGKALGVEIARKVADGDETLRVRLNPAELGRVEVTLSFDDKGALRATVRADHPAALDLLRRDSADLARSLDQAGIRADTQSFRFESRSDGNQGGYANQQQQQQQRGYPGRQGDAQSDLPGTESAYRSLRGTGRVDLLA